MLPEKILAHPTLVLTEAQRAQYFQQGYVVLQDYVPEAWLTRLRQAMHELIDRSRSMTRSDDIYVLEDGHTADAPRLHRITSPQDQHPTFWDFLTDPVMTDLAADVVGPDVKFHHCKLNVKSGSGSRSFKWHQDIPGWPHTDFSPVTFGIYSDRCEAGMGPLSVVPGTNLGPLYSMWQGDNFVIHASDNDIAWLREEMVVRATGGPGTTLLLNCRTLHGSATNTSSRMRPLLLPVYSSADSFAYTPSPIVSPHMGDVIRGKPAKYASIDPRPVELPPDFRYGYRPPWQSQNTSKQAAPGKGPIY